MVRWFKKEGSKVTQGSQQYLIRGVGLLRSADEIKSIVIAAHNGPDMLLIGRMPGRILPNGVIGRRFAGLWFMMRDKTRVLTCPITTFAAIRTSPCRP